MIGIEVAGEFLDLYPDTRINLKLINPIFADGNVIPGSYSIPFTVPGGDSSPKNARLLKNPDVVENQEADPRLSANIWFDGIRYKTGKIKIDIGGNSQTSITFRFGLTTISEDFKKLKLRDLVSEVIDMAPSHTYTKKVFLAARTTTYGGTFNINVNGKVYSGASNSAIAAAINADVEEPRARATYIASVLDPGATDHFSLENYDDPNNVLAPLEIDLPESESWARWFIEADDFEADYNGPIQTWLNDYHSATPSSTKLRFGLVKNSGLFTADKTEPGRGGLIAFSSPFINLADADDFLLNRPVSNGSFNPRNYTSIVPFVRLRHLIDRIKTIVDIEGDFETYTDLDEAVIIHSNALDTPIQFIGTFKWLATRTVFNINEFVPDITVVDFLKGLQTRFNIAVYFNERTNKIRMQSRDAILADDNFTEISNLCAKKQRVTYELNPSGIRLIAAGDNDDKLSIEDSFEIGNPDTEIVSPISGFNQQEAHNPHIFRRWLITSLTSKAFESIVTDREFNTKIPFTIGFYEYRSSLDTSAIDYPTIVKDSPSGPFTFTGLAETRWKKYLRFLFNRKGLPVDVQFEIRHLLEIDWEKKYTFDRVKYLIASLDITLTMRGIEPIKSELYPTGLGVLP